MAPCCLSDRQSSCWRSAPAVGRGHGSAFIHCVSQALQAKRHLLALFPGRMQESDAASQRRIDGLHYYMIAGRLCIGLGLGSSFGTTIPIATAQSSLPW